MNILVRPYCTSSPPDDDEEDLESSWMSKAAAALVSMDAVAALANDEGEPVEREGCKRMCVCISGVDQEGVLVM